MADDTAAVTVEFQSAPEGVKQLQLQVGWTAAQLTDAVTELNGWDRSSVVVVCYSDGNEIRASSEKLSQLGITAGSTIYVKKDWAKCVPGHHRHTSRSVSSAAACRYGRHWCDR